MVQSLPEIKEDKSPRSDSSLSPSHSGKHRTKKHRSTSTSRRAAEVKHDRNTHEEQGEKEEKSPSEDRSEVKELVAEKSPPLSASLIRRSSTASIPIPEDTSDCAYYLN
jgi:hypothetical protein